MQVSATPSVIAQPAVIDLRQCTGLPTDEEGL
jgi:hypothetical protein